MSNSFSILPCIRTLSTSRRTLLVDRLGPGQHAAAFKLILDAAQRGDNIGSDEFPSLDKFNKLMTYSEALTLSEIEDGHLECLILVSPCKPVRSVHPSLASVHIVTSKSFAQKMFWKELVQLSDMFILSGLKQSAYSAVVTYVFVVCVDRMLAMRESGFLITACVPLAGVLEGSHVGHCGSYIMYKHLGLEPIAYPCLHDTGVSVLPATISESPFPTLDYLPFEHVLHGGVTVHVRALVPDDISALYEAFTAEIRLGTGYGLDELPTLEFFRYRYVNEWCTLVFELSTSSNDVGITSAMEAGLSLSTDAKFSNDVKLSLTSPMPQKSQCDSVKAVTSPLREIVAYGNFGPSSYARSARPVIADVNVIVLPKWRGRKWSLDVMKVCLQGIASRGYLGVQGEASVDNVASIKMMLGTGYVINGTLPMGIFYKNIGWVDSNMSYIPLSVIQQNI